jgi:hypothetical protein
MACTATNGSGPTIPQLPNEVILLIIKCVLQLEPAVVLPKMPTLALVSWTWRDLYLSLPSDFDFGFWPRRVGWVPADDHELLGMTSLVVFVASKG